MRASLVLFFVFIGLFQGNCQSFEIKGVVLDDDQNLPIPFVHVYSPNKFGTICNEQGLFKIALDSNVTIDSIVFSSIGFYEKKISINEILSDNKLVVKLSKKDYLLEEVQITPMNETVVIGPDFIKGNCNLSYLASIPFQVGILIDVPFQAKIIAAEFYIMKTKYSKTAFRARIYKYDTITKKPSIELTNKTILGQPKKKKGWTRVNLEQENIFVFNEKVFIAFELIYVGDEYYHKERILNEKHQQYGARVQNCIYNKDELFYQMFLKDYKTNNWFELIFNPEKNEISFPLIRVELEK